MIKILQAEMIYTKLCYEQLQKEYQTDKEKLEKILTIMQYEAIVDRKKPLYKVKTYLYDEKIYISYISDLLEVMPLSYLRFYQ